MLSTHQVDDVTAICSSVVVLLAVGCALPGRPAELGALAAGKVWRAQERDESAELSWRSGNGAWRHIGAKPPPGVELAAATPEDGYLLLAGSVGSERDDVDGHPRSRAQR